MKFIVIFLTFFIYHGYAMGDPRFLPGNPSNAKDLPDIEDLHAPSKTVTKKESADVEQREEEQPNPKDDRKAPPRAKEKQ